MHPSGNKEKYLGLTIHAFIGWALCGTIMGVGPQVLGMDTTLVVHAVAVPFIFGALTLAYYRFFGSTTPLITALYFTLFVIFMDAFVVAALILKSFDMFTSIVGTWLPFSLIFLSTYFVGKQAAKPAPNHQD